MIPEAAVEAAARMCLKEAYPWADWGQQGEDSRRFYRESATRILEAAAPHMLAQAWEEGFDYARSSSYYEGCNPYTAEAQVDGL